MRPADYTGLTYIHVETKELSVTMRLEVDENGLDSFILFYVCRF
jgi:hypothetical protein